MSDDDYSQMPKDKTELMERIRREWTALERAIQQAGDERMSVPDAGGWSIKDNLAHLAAWERFMRLHYFRRLPPHEVMGVDEATYERVDEDGQNAILFERDKDRPAAEVIAELRQSHEQVLADLEPMLFADLMKPRDDDPEARPLIVWVIGNTYDHYREHRASIERLIERLDADSRG